VNKFVLLTNDDGIGAPGIQALRTCIGPLWETIIVAPDREQSAASHALTLNRPLRVNRIDSRTMAVDGTPTDCVMLSLTGLLKRKPDLVISGINNGANLGDDVIYSGTVAGAAESVILGVPAIAVSLADSGNTDFGQIAEIALKIARTVMNKTMPKGVFLNVNIPGQWTGKRFEITSLGSRSYRDVIVEKNDPRGRPYYWIGGQVEAWQGDETCDFASIDRGNVSITPLHLNMTASHALEELKTWDFFRGE
jgi:5'-nucleotidase